MMREHLALNVISLAKKYYPFLLRRHYDDVVQTAALVKAEYPPAKIWSGANRELYRLAHELGYYRPNLPGRPWIKVTDIEEVAARQKPSVMPPPKLKDLRIDERWETSPCRGCGRPVTYRKKKPRKFCGHECYRAADPALRRFSLDGPSQEETCRA